MEGMIDNPEMASRFIFGGNSIFTLRSQKTGAWYTYKARMSKKTEGKSLVYFVSLLTGQNNEEDYSYIGILGDDKKFHWTKKSTVELGSPSIMALKWVTDHLAVGTMPPMAEIWHHGRCGRCGRLLTVPESVASGLGPDCAGRMLMGW